MSWNASPNNDDDRVKSRMHPDEAAAAIMDLVARRTESAVVASPMIMQMARAAVTNPHRAASMMKVWQLDPLVAKQEEDEAGSSGI